MRGSSLGTTILQQMLAQLDPQQMGMGIFIAKCMPLSSGKVCSVRTIVSRGTGIWEKIEHVTSFHGIESQIGHTVQERTVFADFQQRVTQRIVEAMRNQELLPRPQAEMEVWQELEDILLHTHTDT